MMLYIFHVILIACGILFCFGYSLYELSSYSRSGPLARNALALLFFAAGIGFSFYLRAVLRYGLRGRPPERDGMPRE